MAKIDTVKFILSIYAAEDMDMIATDVDEAYLTTRVNHPRKQRSVLDSPLPSPDETYYVRRPPGTNDSELPYLMKPEAFIYGHPRASLEFNADLHEVLTDHGLVPTNYDLNVYVLNNDIGKAIMARAVDDMPMCYTGGKAMLDLVLGGVRNSYEITVDDPIETILGLGIYRDRPNRRMRLQQRGSIDNFLNQHLPDWETMPFEKLPFTPMV